MKKVIFFLVLFFLFLYPTPLSLNPTYAQTTYCTNSGTPVVQNGLVSTPNLGQSLVNSSGVCIIDPKAAFAPYKVPGFDELKSLYFDQAKQIVSVTKHSPLVGDKTQADIPMTTGTDHLYYIKKTTSSSTDGNLAIQGNPSGTQTGIIFVEGNLNIDLDLTYGSPTTGLVFIVKGNVIINKNVTQVDAVIISSGTICTTAEDYTSCPASNTGAAQLIINGSLISLTDSAPIQFKRTLSDNTQPAEKIIHQVKYVVILRNLISDTLQRWSEIP